MATSHEQVARVLLEAGAVVGAQTNDGWTALMLAAHNGHEQVARVLLEVGADRNIDVFGFHFSPYLTAPSSKYSTGTVQ